MNKPQRRILKHLTIQPFFGLCRKCYNNDCELLCMCCKDGSMKLGEFRLIGLKGIRQELFEYAKYCHRLNNVIGEDY